MLLFVDGDAFGPPVGCLVCYADAANTAKDSATGCGARNGVRLEELTVASTFTTYIYHQKVLKDDMKNKQKTRKTLHATTGDHGEGGT